jgi:hypothetical protein
MKRHPVFNVIVSLTFLFFCFSGCHLLRNQVTDATPSINSLSKSAVENALNGANGEVSALRENLVKNLKSALDTLNPEIQKQLTQIMDTIGNLSAAQIKAIGLSIDAQVANLKGQVEDKQLIGFFLNALDSVMGKVDVDARKALNDILQATLDSLNNKSTQAKIQGLMNTVLGDSTKAKVQNLANSLEPVIYKVLDRIDKTRQGAGNQLQKIIITSIIALFLGLILFLYMRNRLIMRDKVFESMSSSINELKDIEPKAYDALTKKIKSKTLVLGVEPFLRERLEKRGIQKPLNFKA